MQHFRLQLVQFFILCSSFAVPAALAESVFSGVEKKPTALTPLPTDEEVAEEETRQIEAQKPKPLIKREIPQRAEQLTSKTFMILPREAPLPTGTLSGGFFIEETGEAPPPEDEIKLIMEIQKAQAAANEVSGTAREAASETALERE